MEEKKVFIIDDTPYVTGLTKKFAGRKKYSPPNPKHITAFIPGSITGILVKKGQAVKQGEILLKLEAMKMNNSLTSPLDGIIKIVHVSEGTVVSKNQLLIELE